MEKNQVDLLSPKDAEKAKKSDNCVKIVIDSFEKDGKKLVKLNEKYIRVTVPGIASREEVKAWLIKMLPRLVEALKREDQSSEDEKDAT